MRVCVLQGRRDGHHRRIGLARWLYAQTLAEDPRKLKNDMKGARSSSPLPHPNGGRDDGNTLSGTPADAP
jgi:hypothetical protein